MIAADGRPRWCRCCCELVLMALDRSRPCMQSVLEQAGVRYTVYSGRSWTQYFGDAFTAFKDAPLIYAHYDLVPSFYDAVAAPMYGGWEGCVQLIRPQPLIAPMYGGWGGACS